MLLLLLTQGPLLPQAPLMSPSIEVRELIISIIGGGRRLRDPTWEWNQLKQLPLTHENECALLREHQYEWRTTLDDWRQKGGCTVDAGIASSASPPVVLLLQPSLASRVREIR